MGSLAIAVPKPLRLARSQQLPVLPDENVHISNSEPAAGMTAREAAQYWYGRALRALRQRVSDPKQLIQEYQHVLALDDCIQHTTEVARSHAAHGRNRYCNVLPYDENRVVLQGDQQYINASHIQLQLPTLQRPCSYIATQGPLPSTANDFWRMVYDLKVPAIVMLTNVSECGVTKCAQYFPAQENGKARLPSFKIQVERVVPFSPDCTLRTMRLSDISSALPRGGDHVLTHYHFHAWPDHGTPDSTSGLRAVCRSLSTARDSGKPVVVHCSAGIGRTGTFCAIDILLQRLDSWLGPQQQRASNADKPPLGPDRAEVEATLNIPNLVHELRRKRMGMVQTLEQYAFVYKAMIDDLAARTAQSETLQQPEQQLEQCHPRDKR